METGPYKRKSAWKKPDAHLISSSERERRGERFRIGLRDSLLPTWLYTRLPDKARRPEKENREQNIRKSYRLDLKLNPEADSDLIEWIESHEHGKRSSKVRLALRVGIS